ncbi:MAG: CerR family C-terminal domain-containing protein [Planctomycetota bacterium]
MVVPERLDTRQNLLEAAREVFVEHGYHKAGVREIARRADANVAAVNYHFGSKAELYRQVLTTVFESIPASLAMPRLADDPENPEALVARFVRWHAERVLGRRAGDFTRLFLREMQEPSPVFATFIDLSIRPIFNTLTEIVAAILEIEPFAVEARQAAVSIVGQYVIYKHNEAMLPQFFPEVGFDDDEVAALAERIAAFSIGGLRELKARIHGEGGGEAR